MIGHDDGDRRRGTSGRLGRGSRPRHDHVDWEPYQLGRQGRKPFGAVAVPSALDDDVPAFDVTEVPQPLEESPPEVRGLWAGGRGPTEKADSIDLRRYLCLRAQRCGEEADGTREEGAPVHG